MKVKKRKPSRKWDKHGVSEIIGNLLILGITVTLFSSVLWFVVSMPPPNQEVYTDFSGTAEIASTGKCWINVTNRGGQILDDFRTKIYVFVNDAPTSLGFNNSTEGHKIGSTWTTGETWVYDKLTGVTDSTKISISIIDYVANSMVWSSVLRGQNGEFPPIIGERGLTPSPSYVGKSVRFYATVMDPDGDLNRNSVFINATPIGLSLIQLADTNHDGIFVSSNFTADIVWNGKMLLVNATDLTNRRSSARMTLSVLQTETIIEGGGGGGGGRGEPPGNLNYSGLQGFNIFEWSQWNGTNYSSTPRTHFLHGEIAVVVVASKYLVNLANSNIILVMDPTSKNLFEAVSTPNNEFVRYDYNSGYYVYNCSIETSLLQDNSAYLIEAQLRDSWVPNNVFFMDQVIYVGSTAFEPSFLTFKDSAFSVPSTKFNTTDKMYVEIRDLYGGAWDQNAGDVEIRDFFWNAQVKRNPPYVGGATYDVLYNGPVSNVWQLVSTPTKYRFVVNLYNATSGSPWIPGTNSYVLRYDMFKAQSETYLLSRIINITAPQWKADIVVGGESTGNGRFATYAGLFYYKNDNQWSPPDVLETSGDKSTMVPDIVLVKMGDVDGDLRNDFVIVRGTATVKAGPPYVLSIYYNHGGWVRLDIATLPAKPSKLALGNIDLDSDLDIIVAYSDGNQNNAVYLYRNDGLWTRSWIGEMAGTSYGVVSLIAADMDPSGTTGNDPQRSWDLVVGRANGIITIYKNTFGDGSAWTPTSISGTTADVYDWSINDISVYGHNTTGSYLQTTNPYQDDGIYEQLLEELIYKRADTWPTAKGPKDNCSDSIEDFKWTSTSPYTVQPGWEANVNKWDSTNLTDSPSFKVKSIIFSVKVRTYGATYVANDWIKWWSSNGSTWTSHDMIEVSDTAGGYQILYANLTSDFASKTLDLANLNVTFSNSDSGANVDFSWAINVTYFTDDRLDHRWQMNLRASVTTGTPHVFGVYAVRSISTDGDNFRFAYSTDNVIFTNITLSPTADVTRTTLPMLLYTGNIPGSVSGTVYIRVTDVKTGVAAPAPDFIKVGQMYVKTSATVSTIGTKLLCLDVKDINGDRANDLAVATLGTGKPAPGKIWVAFNDPAGILTKLVQVVPDNTNFEDVKDIGIGRFFGANTKPNLDVMLATSTSLYLVRNNGGGSFSIGSQVLVPVGGINVALAGDVDGNGWTDIVVITSNNNILLYADYGPRVDGSIIWQIYPVDNLGSACTILCADLGKTQK